MLHFQAVLNQNRPKSVFELSFAVQSNLYFHVTVLYHTLMYSYKGVRGQKFSRVPRVSRDKSFQRCQGLKGAKGAWVTSSEGLLRGRVLSRTHFRSSLSPEEGPSCLFLLFIKYDNYLKFKIVFIIHFKLKCFPRSDASCSEMFCIYLLFYDENVK